MLNNKGVSNKTLNYIILCIQKLNRGYYIITIHVMYLCMPLRDLKGENIGQPNKICCC